MPKIRELGFELANLIAAGEVVNRPASAIKELVENSIDAGADKITVEIQKGGVLLMRVTDNGCGMDPEDLVLCIKRHATSKIKCAKDIDSINTMGFRGEALAALSAVTEMRIISKTEEAEYGYMLSSEYGNVLDISERGAAKGTTVIAENLFMNMPARRKFLKRDITEAGAVVDCVEKLALSHPEIAFRVISDGVSKLETSGNGKLEDVIYRVYGKDNAKNLIKINGKYDGVEIYGFIGSPMNHKVNRAYQTFFVNKRCITSPMMSTALSQAFTSYIPSDRFPVGVIFVNVNPLLLDVNVHPSKQEVKFVNESTVFGAIYHTCTDALADMWAMPDLSGGKEKENAYSDAPKPSTAEEAAPLIVNRDSEGREVTSSLKKNQMSIDEMDMHGEEESGTEKNQEKIKYVEFEPGLKIPAPNKEYMSDYAREKVQDKNVSAEDIAMLVSMKKDGEKPYSHAESSEQEKNAEAKNNMPPEKEPADKPNGENYLSYRDAVKTVEKKNADENNTEKISYQDTVKYYKTVGEMFNKYIVVETANPFGHKKALLIDKHAAHERMIFERMKKSLAESKRFSQMLAVPVRTDLGREWAEAAQRYMKEMNKLGFEFEADGQGVIITAIPSSIDCNDAEGMFRMVITSLGLGIKNQETLPEVMDKSLYVLACKAAVKGGVECDEYTVERIVEAVINNPEVRFCPHGRPVVYEISLEKIDAMFKR